MDLCPLLIRPLLFEKMDDSPLFLLPKVRVLLRATKRFDPGIRENDPFFLVPLPPPPVVDILAALPIVPVDISSVTGADVMLLDGEDEREWCGFFDRRILFQLPSHRFRGGVSHGDDDTIITLSKSFASLLLLLLEPAVVLDFLEDVLLELTFRDEAEGDRLMK